MSAQTDRKTKSEGATTAFRARERWHFTATERDAGYPQAMRAITEALRAIGYALAGDNRVRLDLPPTGAP